MATCRSDDSDWPSYSALRGLSLDVSDVLYHFLVTSHDSWGVLPDDSTLATECGGVYAVVDPVVFRKQLMPVFAAFLAPIRSDDTTCLSLWHVVEQADLAWSHAEVDGVDLPPTVRQHYAMQSAAAKKHPCTSITYKHEYIALCRGTSLVLPFPASVMTKSATLLSMARFPTTSAAFQAHSWIQYRIDGHASRSFTRNHLLASGRRVALCFPNYVSPGDCWSRFPGNRFVRWAREHITRVIPPSCSRAPCQWWVQRFHGLQVVNDVESAYLVDAYLDIFQDAVRRIQRCADTDQALLRRLREDGVPVDDARGWLMPYERPPQCTGQSICQCHKNPVPRFRHALPFRFG